VEGSVELSTEKEYNSDNTERLSIEQIKAKLLTVDYVRQELERFKATREAATTKTQTTRLKG
jgi:UDP-glucose 4-epimerase